MLGSGLSVSTHIWIYTNSNATAFLDTSNQELSALADMTSQFIAMPSHGLSPGGEVRQNHQKDYTCIESVCLSDVMSTVTFGNSI